MWRLFLIDFIIIAMIGALLSLTIFNINNTIIQTDKKADQIANTTIKVQDELADQVKSIQMTLDSNRHLLNLIGNESDHIDAVTNHTNDLITKNRADILQNRAIQLDILNNLTNKK